jgi:predicted metallopeptidase
MAERSAISSPAPRLPGRVGGFNFTQHIRTLCVDLTTRLQELAHIDMSRVAIRFCQARIRSRHGIYASLTPLRFAGGELISRRRGRVWTVERLFDDAGREMLYLLSFYLPRFMERPLEEKLSTVVHELWHIGPGFDGDLRRHPGRCYAHTHSQREYDALMDEMTRKWLSLAPPAGIYEFLRFDFRGLEARFGRVYGQKIRTPRLLRAG